MAEKIPNRGLILKSACDLATFYKAIEAIGRIAISALCPCLEMRREESLDGATSEVLES